MNTSRFSDIKAVIFDYGGTLDTDARHWAHVLWDGFKHAGVAVSEEEFRQAYVFVERALAKSPVIMPQDDFHTLLKKKTDMETEYLVNSGLWNTDEENRKEAARTIADYCNRYAHNITNKNKTVVNDIRKHYTTVLVSNFYGNLESVLKGYSMNGLFEDIIESAKVGLRKPAPEIFRLGVKACNCKAEETVVIGDSFGKDILPAHESGCKTIWFKGEEWIQSEVDETIPDAIITDLNQLYGLLEISHDEKKE